MCEQVDIFNDPFFTSAEFILLIAYPGCLPLRSRISNAQISAMGSWQQIVSFSSPSICNMSALGYGALSKNSSTVCISSIHRHKQLKPNIQLKWDIRIKFRMPLYM